jgi:hypothetical protein
MIEIIIDKTTATKEELAALEIVDGYDHMVTSLTKSGCQLGVSLMIKEPTLQNDGIYWFTNTPDGTMSCMIGHCGKGKSFLH